MITAEFTFKVVGRGCSEADALEDAIQILVENTEAGEPVTTDIIEDTGEGDC